MSKSAKNPGKKVDVCPHQFAFMLDNWFRKLLHRPEKIVGDYIKAGDTVIDLGCGPGFFSIDMAKMVGKEGRVIAVDLQKQMIEKVKKKAKKHSVIDRMDFHQCEQNKIGLTQTADFALAYYMVHEVPDSKSLLKEIKGMLKTEGKLLIVEPKMHVSDELFKTMLKDAEDVGFKVVDFPKGKGGRSILLTKS